MNEKERPEPSPGGVAYILERCLVLSDGVLEAVSGLEIVIGPILNEPPPHTGLAEPTAEDGDSTILRAVNVLHERLGVLRSRVDTLTGRVSL